MPPLTQTGAATNMYSMLGRASAFNQPIGGWAVGRVQNFDYMLCGALSFDQDLAPWSVDSAAGTSACSRVPQPFSGPRRRGPRPMLTNEWGRAPEGSACPAGVNVNAMLLSGTAQTPFAAALVTLSRTAPATQCLPSELKVSPTGPYTLPSSVARERNG